MLHFYNVIYTGLYDIYEAKYQNMHYTYEEDVKIDQFVFENMSKS